MADVKIVMAAHKRGQVFVDGQEIPSVFAVEFSAAADSLTEVRLTLRPQSVEIEGPAQVVRVPARPEPPAPRVSRGSLMFDSPAELAAWKAEPWWRRLLGLTAYDRKMARRPGSNPPAGYQPRPMPPSNPPPGKD